ncbi:MAG TPA: 3-hydroxyacyl-CoA dehydrogenase family protein [Solirubrobacterales bacterium]|nr:3-hydroxyacyl-CoA dehydrogenase family protein [Solirubrobacterales bacterium]
MTQMNKVAVVGSGTMGSQIALQTALSGRHEVTLTDADAAQLERARVQNEKLLARQLEKERLTQQQLDAARGALTYTADLAEALNGADLVIEAIYENLDAKRELFRKLDELAPPGAILASNSSSIAISRLASETQRPERCCNLHFFHPVTVMELCEVVRGPETSDETAGAAMEFVRSIGRVPVLLQKEIHGFIANRILFAAADEALNLLEGGYATVEDIDTAVRKGLNWPMGIFQLLDFSGIDVFYGALKDRHEKGEGAPPRDTLRKKVEAGELGRKTGKGFYEY